MDDLDDLMFSTCLAMEADRASSRDVTLPAHALVGELRGALGERPLARGLRARASTGRGARWANVPWVALMDPRETESAQDGRYVAVLIHGDGSGLTVALVWGTARLRRERGADIRRALDARRARAAASLPGHGALADAGFRVGERSELGASSALARDYERSCVAHRSFSLDALGQGADVGAAVDAALSAYLAWLDAGS